MGAFRQDRISGDWAIIAPERGLRPRTHRSARPVSLPRFDADCPFCPGNEKQLHGILFELATDLPPGWKIRAVPNKYPIARLSTPVPPSPEDAVHGAHEVIVESPRHDAGPDAFTDGELTALMSTYRRRFSELLSQPGIEAVILFRNHGPAGGASLAHPHSQLVGLGEAPPRLRVLADRMRGHWSETGRCLACDVLSGELADGRRVVEETAAFATFVPRAATVPFETWILPKRHQASFRDLTEPELAAFGRALRSALQRLKAAADDPPYNFALESFDFLDGNGPHAHWRMRIMPVLVTWGGFELAAGVPINPSSPESDAAALRAPASLR